MPFTVFYGIFAGMIILSAIIVLLPKLSLVGIMLATQQMAGILSPAILIFIVLLANKKEVMGQYTNSKTQNIIIWIINNYINLMLR